MGTLPAGSPRRTRRMQLMASLAQKGQARSIGRSCQSRYDCRSPERRHFQMPTRNVVLTEHHEKVIAELVASGRYQNASEVLREGLRLIEERDARDAAKLKILQEAARAGFADFDANRFVELDDEAVMEVIRNLGRQARGRNRGTQP